tara:strand:- start:149 stop:805 length:657 start_codon:yes stop_codon:yes gene_type:complete
MYKFIIISIVITCFLSCSSIETKRIAPGYQQAYYAIKNYFAGNQNSIITPEIVESIPYASALLQIDEGPVGLVILESIVGNKFVWISEDNVYIVTENGRIVETRGLENNLIKFNANYNYKNESSFGLIHNSYYSYDKPELNNLKIKVKLSRSDLRSYKLFSKKIKLSLIEEEVSNDYLGWERINKFWVDESGFTWKIEQSISPKLPVIKFEITKKPLT